MSLPPSCSSQNVSSATAKPATPARASMAVEPPCPAARLPYRNTTVSLPSRATAIITSTSRPHQSSCAAEALAPVSRSRLSVRPCFFIQTTICTTRAQATSDMTAWNHSCPSSLSHDDTPSSTSASATASARPAATPPHRYGRPRRPSGAARSHEYRMPTTSSASTLSRQTMKSTCSMNAGSVLGSHHQRAAHVLVEVIEEGIFARPRNGDHHERAHAGPHDLLFAQGDAFEFDRLVAFVDQFDLEAADRHHQPGRLEGAVRLEGQLEGGQLGPRRAGQAGRQPGAQRQRDEPGGTAARHQYPPFLPVPA